MIDERVNEHDANPDPITGAPGAHPLGTGVGAAGGGVAGAVVGGLAAGPLGAVVGAAVGGVAGGLAGKGTAEAFNPSDEEGYWRKNYVNRPYTKRDAPFQDYASAYRYGWESQNQHPGKRYEEVESDLEQGWEKVKGKSTLAWIHAKEATRDAWHRVEKATGTDKESTGKNHS